MRIEVISDLSECKKVWDKFEKENSIWNDWEIVLSFFDSEIHKPHFIVIKEDEKEVGLIPLWLDKRDNKFTHFGGERMENRKFWIKKEYYKHLYKIIPDKTSLFDMNGPNINEIMKSNPNLKNFILEKDKRFFLNLNNIKSVEDFFLRFSKKHKKNLLYDLKMLKSLNYKLIWDNKNHSETLINLSRERFNENSDFNDKDNQKEMYSFLDFIEKKGMLHSLRIEIDGKIEGIEIATIYNNCYYVINGGFNPKRKNLGKLLIMEHIKKAIENNTNQIDFLVGDSGWKDLWNLDKEECISVIKSKERKKDLEPKNFLFITLTNLCGDLAWQIKKEGHNVKYYTEDDEEKDVADGFIEKIDNWENEIDWADIIVFDDVMGQGKIAENLRKKGKKVIGGTEYTDLLEDDRTFGVEEMIKKGISVTPYKDFLSIDEAIEYVKNNPDEYVIKPTGNSKYTTLSILFIGFHPQGLDVIEALERYKQWKEHIAKIQVQKKIKGVEVAVGAFFNGEKFLKPININFEHKKLFTGNLGPQTGEMGTSMIWSNSNKIFDKTLAKFEEDLREKGYIGYIDLNCIVNEEGIYPLEFTSRFGYPTIFIQQEGINMPIAKFMYDLAHSKDFKIKIKNKFQIGVRIVVPPFPFNDDETYNIKSKDTKIYFENDEGIHIEDVKIVNKEWKVAGISGIVMTVCGSGNTIKSAQKEAYQRIKKIFIPRMYYRTDIGDSWNKDKEFLKKLGYLD